MKERIDILLVDDHVIVRRGLRAFFDTQSDLQVIGEAATGQEAVQFVIEHVPDVILMDLVMPDMDGVEATRRIKRLSPHTEIIVLTSYHEDEHIFPALRAGALSYLLKDVEMDDLAYAVRLAVAGEARLHPRIAARVIKDLQGMRDEEPNVFFELTDRELEVLQLIAEGLSNPEIEERLVISENTVKGHVRNILSKLHLADRTKAAVLAWRQGLVRKS
jgi:NarL family two-component system response regulator LiaR